MLAPYVVIEPSVNVDKPMMRWRDAAAAGLATLLMMCLGGWRRQY